MNRLRHSHGIFIKVGKAIDISANFSKDLIHQLLTHYKGIEKHLKGVILLGNLKKLFQEILPREP